MWLWCLLNYLCLSMFIGFDFVDIEYLKCLVNVLDIILFCVGMVGISIWLF